MTATIVAVVALLILIGISTLFWRQVAHLEGQNQKLREAREDFGRACAREAYGGAARAVELWQHGPIDRPADLARHLRHLGDLARAGAHLTLAVGKPELCDDETSSSVPAAPPSGGAA